MKRFSVVLITGLCFASAQTQVLAKMKVTSTSVTRGILGVDHGCSGKNISPQLSWTEGPYGTKAYAVTMVDMSTNAGDSKIVPLVAYDIPATATTLTAGAVTLAISGGGGVSGTLDTSGTGNAQSTTTGGVEKGSVSDLTPIGTPGSGQDQVGGTLDTSGTGTAQSTTTGGAEKGSLGDLSSGSLPTSGQSQVGGTLDTSGTGTAQSTTTGGAEEGTLSNVVPLSGGPSGSTVALLRNDYGKAGYSDVCSPQGAKKALYKVTVYAVSTEKLPIPPSATPARAISIIEGHSLSESSITVKVKR